MTNRYILGILVLIILISGCEKKPTAQRIVDAAIVKYGGERFEKLKLSFDFRNRHYTAERLNGQFVYTRSFTDSTGHIKDIYTNNGFARLVNGDTVDITEERAHAYTNSVNSVIYFTLLPFGLNDPPVIKEYLGKTEIYGNNYHKIRITFKKDGGGKDHDDIFVYWFDTEDYSMDYFSYLYYSDGGGIRFREAVNTRTINGITLSDYKNYGLESINFDVTKTDSLFLNNKMDLISVIELKNIEVEIIE